MADDDSVGTIQVRDRAYPVTLRRYGNTAKFEIKGIADRDGHPLTNETWEGLYKNALIVTKAATTRIAIPIMEIKYRRGDETGAVMRPGTLVGIHGGNGNLLIKWDDRPEVEQDQDSYSAGKRFKPMSRHDVTNYLELLRAGREIDKKIEAIEKRCAYAHGELSREARAEIERVASER